MMPRKSYACSKNSTKTEQSSWSKKKTKKAEHKKNCQDKSCEKCKSEHCGGSCTHNSCKCGASISSLNIPPTIEIKVENHLPVKKKQKFGFKETYYSSSFLSIWMPPKIS